MTKIIQISDPHIVPNGQLAVTLFGGGQGAPPRSFKARKNWPCVLEVKAFVIDA